MEEEYNEKLIFLLENEKKIYQLLIVLFDINIDIPVTDPFDKDWDIVKKEVDQRIENDKSILMLKRLLIQLLKKNEKITALIEDKYIDKYYRSSYYIYFAGKHSNYSRYCQRLIIFLGDYVNKVVDMSVEKNTKDFIGSIVLRPIIGYRIGRTLLNPKYIYEDKMYVRVAKYNITVYGIRLCVDAFPFSMQDGETTSCAETTILNLVDYFCTRYAEYRLLLPEHIKEILSINSSERVIPTTGLSYNEISKLLISAGFQPIIYNKNSLTRMTLKRLLYYYIESGIPVGIGTAVNQTQHHSIICLGHGKIDDEMIGRKIYRYGNSKSGSIWVCDTADFLNQYIVMDDEQLPYTTFSYIEDIKNNNYLQSSDTQIPNLYPEVLIVPLYKRMILDAKTAYDISISFISNKNNFEIKKYMSCEKNFGEVDNPVITRLFLASSRSFKLSMIERLTQMMKSGKYSGKTIENIKNIRKIYSELLLPKFIWICEIYSKNTYNSKTQNFIAQLLIDATTMAKSLPSSILMAHYQDLVLIKKHKVETNTLDYDDLFLSYKVKNEDNEILEFAPYQRNLNIKNE